MNGLARTHAYAHRLLPALILLTTTASVITAQPEAGTEALLRQRGEAFAEALNRQGDALVAFARDHLASSSGPDLAARFASSMRDNFAAFGSVERYAVQVLPSGVVFVFCKRAKGGAWQNYQFRVLPNDEHRLQLVFRAVAVEPLERPNAPIASDDARRWLGQFETRLEQQQPFSGVALVRRGGQDIYTLIRGMRDATKRLPVTRASRFGMASGSKMFTAVAILQLAQAGKLSLSDPLIKYLPDFPNRAFAARATIHQLLTHTAGAGNYWTADYEKAWGSITALGQMLPFVLPHLAAAPPAGFTYSNSGYILLGFVIEAVSGLEFESYLRTRLFQPAGMTATGFPIRAAAGPDAALPYEPEMDAGAVKPGAYLPVTIGGRGSSAGGASTTVDDLVRFADALRRGVILDTAHVARLTEAHVSTGARDQWYGYGAFIERARGILSYGHGGMAPGTQFEFKIYPERDTVLVVMSNLNTIAGPELASALDHLIRNPAP